MQFRWLGLIVILWGALTMVSGVAGNRSLLTSTHSDMGIASVQR